MPGPAYHATVHEDGRLEVHHPNAFVSPSNTNHVGLDPVRPVSELLEALRGQLAREEDAASRWAAVAVDYQRLARNRHLTLSVVRADLLRLASRLRSLDAELAVEVLDIAARAGR